MFNIIRLLENNLFFDYLFIFLFILFDDYFFSMKDSLPMLGLISQKPSQSMSPTASSSHRSRHRLDTSMMLKYSSSEEY